MVKRSLIVKICLVLMGLISVLVLIDMGQVILPFIFAGILAYFLQPLGDYLLKRNLPLILTIIIVYLTFILLSYLLLFLALPMLIEEFVKIAVDIPDYLLQFQNFLWELHLPVDFTQSIMSVFDFSANSDLPQQVALWLRKSLKYLFALLLAPLLSYYILRDKDKMRIRLIALLPIGERAEIQRIAGDINRIFRSFFSGYVLLGLIVGVLSLILLSVLRIRYALILAIILGIADLIPYFGPFIGAIPAVLVAFLKSPLSALYVIIGIVIIQQLEGSVLSPRIIGSRIGLNPLTVIFTVLASGFYFGMFGLIFAVPVTAALKLIVSYVYCRLSRAKV